MKFKAMVFSLLFFVFSQTAYSQDEAPKTDDPQAEYKLCLEKAGWVTAEMLKCTYTETNKHLDEIEATYAELMRIVSPKRQQELKKAHEAWRTFRQTYWEFRMGGSIGTSVNVMAAGFLLDTASAYSENLKLDLSITREALPDE